jgi:riboflavin kinase/FMN adenylyltransferase
VAPLVEVDGEAVSSTQIRALISAGDVERAAEMLGGPFIVEGEVVHGDKRGRTLGVPTANIVPDERFVHPGHGVYAAWAHGHAAAVNVGVRPQFQTGRGLLVEAYLIGYEGDLYGETLRIAFAKRLRGERRFESVDALVDQMKKDIAEAETVAEEGQRP